MSDVRVSSQTLNSSISVCNDVIRMLSALQKDLWSKYNTLGSKWNDTKYEQLGDIVKDCNSSIKKTINELKQCQQPLNKLRNTIQDYESLNIVGINNTDGGSSAPTQIGMNGISGCSYRDCINFSTGLGGSEEVHHMPANSVNGLKLSYGPAITMSRADHQRTASYDNKSGSSIHRQRQAELIRQERFMEAIQMDIDDIHIKFGDKYDEGISAMMEYVERLFSESRL